MRFCHICPSCGRDLTRVRPAREPRYGLRIVTCPGCRHVSVRGRTWLDGDGRAARRVGSSLFALLVQAAVFAALLPLIWALAFELGRAWHATGSPFKDIPLGALVLLVLVPVATGTWLTAGLAHWPRSVAWAVFFTAAALLLCMDTVFLPATDSLLLTIDPHHERWKPLGFEFDILLHRLGGLAGLGAASLLGVPVGRGLRALDARYRRHRWRARRRRRTPRRLTA